MRRRIFYVDFSRIEFSASRAWVSCDELSVQCGGSSSVNRTPKLQIILRIRLDVRQAGRYPRPHEFDKLLLMVFWFMQHTDIQSAREGNLCLRKITQPTNGTERPRQKSKTKGSLGIVPADCCSGCRRDSPCAPSNNFPARRAVPDSDGGPLYCVLQILRKFSRSFRQHASTTVRTLPQKVQVYRACWDISILFTCLRREAP
jgi:hypothetical protein